MSSLGLRLLFLKYILYKWFTYYQAVYGDGGSNFRKNVLNTYLEVQMDSTHTQYGIGSNY